MYADVITGSMRRALDETDRPRRRQAYLVHDLKNVLAQLDLVVKNAQRHGDNPAFVADAFKTVENAASKMRRMLEQLRQPQRPPGAAGHVDLAALLGEVTRDRATQSPAPILEAEAVPRAERDRLGAVFAHLIQNAQEATPDTGHVWVRLRAGAGQAVVEIEDDGQGMDEAFIEDARSAPSIPPRVTPAWASAPTRAANSCTP